MGRRGPPPKSAAELRDLGNPHATRRARHEPRVKEGSLVRPRGLSAPERAVWDDVAKALADLGVVGRPDRRALRRYVRLSVDLEAETRALRRDGYVTVDRFGQETESARWRVVKAMCAELLKLEDRFGLSPSARAGLGAAGARGETKPSEEENPRRAGVLRLA